MRQLVNVIFALSILVLLIGCATLDYLEYHDYKEKRRELNQYRSELENNQAMTQIEKNRVYWEKVKIDLPKYADNINYLIKYLQYIQTKADKGDDIEKDLLEFEEKSLQFWEKIEVREKPETTGNHSAKPIHCTTFNTGGPFSNTTCY